MSWGTSVTAEFISCIEQPSGLLKYTVRYRKRLYSEFRREAFSFDLSPGDTVQCDRGYSGNVMKLRIRRKI